MNRLDDGSLRVLLGSIEGLISSLSEGLAEFFRQERCRVVLIAEVLKHDWFVCGDRDLLHEHPALLDWLRNTQHSSIGEPPIEITGSSLLCLNNKQAVAHTWFMETPKNLCSSEPIYQWLRFASEVIVATIASSVRASENFVNRNRKNAGLVAVVPDNYHGNRRQLAGYATEAISEWIRDEVLDILKSLDAGQYFAVADFLKAALQISTMTEEGSLAHGTLCLYIGDHLEGLPFAARFEPGREPLLGRTKHVRKLLTSVSDPRFSLVTDGEVVYGILSSLPNDVYLVAGFKGRTGEVLFRGETVCTLSAGRYHGTFFMPTADTFFRAFAKSGLMCSPDLINTVRAIVGSSVQGRHGCTIVIDGSRDPLVLSGQTLCAAIPILDPTALALACGMSNVDGALQLDCSGQLHSFGCLLDGARCENENLSRGARYNSALRFSASNDKVLVIVASEDGWLSAFAGGRDLLETGTTTEDTGTVGLPPRLRQWLRAAPPP